METGELIVFPQYLERANPGHAFIAGGDLAWIDALISERLTPHFIDGHVSLTYQPESPGNYLARWYAGGEVFYRYFSVIEDDWVVLSFSTFVELESEPTLHATGIPLDYRLPTTIAGTSRSPHVRYSSVARTISCMICGGSVIGITAGIC